MSEILFVLAATVVVFALFLLVFFLKGRSERGEAPRPACVRCNCHRSQEQHIRSLEYLKQNQIEDQA